MLPRLAVAELNSMHGILYFYEMQNIASARLFVSFSYNYKRKLYKAIFTQERIYYFAPWATQLMEDCHYWIC